MSFLDVLAPVLHVIAEKGIRVAVNAGSADTQLLQQAVQALIEKGNLSLKTAWVSGDEVLNQVQSQVKKGGLDALKNMDTGEQLSRWEYEPIYAQAYLGAFGVAKALEEGADIVICGRVADASLCMGGAIWWHGWKPSQHNELAAALVCGHLIECSTYVTGANFSGFKSVPDNIDPGLPIAELGRKGEIVITKLQGTGGIVSKNTVKSQLLYEIQGPW